MDSGSDSSDDVYEDAVDVCQFDHTGNGLCSVSVTNDGHGDHMQPTQSTHTTVHCIGGSVSAKIIDAAKHVAGDQPRELIKELLEHDALQDQTGTARSGIKEVHVHLTQTNVHSPTALTLGGTVVVNGPSSEEEEALNCPPTPSQLQKLRWETEKSFQKWSNGMVKTTGTQAILDMISQGRTWITVTGSPGEGKTTTGYLALKHLNSMGRQVYDIKTPEDYFRVKDKQKPVLMFNDILGSLHFDHDKRWKEVITDILAVIEHKREEDTENVVDRQNQPAVIFISRSNVLTEASPYLGRFKEFILSQERVVDLTHGYKTSPEERRKIWNYHSDMYNITVPEKTVREVCKMELPHGFPHCCRLFASMYSRDKTIGMKSFFKKPLEFLNQTIEALMMETITGPLLRDMLKNDGSLDLDTISDDERRFQFASVVDSLSGTYLDQDENTVTFHHPSVYDSVAFVLCRKNPLFVIENCSLTFLNERIRIDGVDYGSDETFHHTVTVSSRYTKKFLQRLLEAVENCDLSLALNQYAFHDEHFTSQFMQSLIPNNNRDDGIGQLIHKLDKKTKESFLFLSTKSRSDKILKHICAFTELTEDEIADTLLGICEHNSISSYVFLEERFHVNINVKNSESKTPLMLAATKCSEEMLELLLKRDVDVNAEDSFGVAALHTVCRHGVDGDGGVVKTLIDKGADVNRKSFKYPWLPLNIACNQGHLNVVKTLVECGADLNTTARGGITPLHDASWMGHADIVTFLLDRGASVNTPNSDINGGKTPFHDACEMGHLSSVSVLLERGAKINKRSRSGCKTPLHYACSEGHADVATLLLDNGANVNKTDIAGKTPLHDTCLTHNTVEVAKALLNYEADVNKRDLIGQTALHKACCDGNVGIVTLLLDSKADVNCGDTSGDTPLHTACEYGHVAAVMVLINRGADINKANSDRDTPLHTACDYGHGNVVSVLVDKGADVNKTNTNGDTPLNIAQSFGNIKLMSIFSDRGV